MARNFNFVKTFRLMAMLVGCLLLAGCAGGGVQSTNAPLSGTAPSDSIRVGDKITVTLSGVPTEEGYVHEFQIPDSGEISLPNLTRSFHAAGLQAGELAAQITQAYKAEKIYSNPNIAVIPEERFVNVGGDVRTPSRVPYTRDLTLLSAINSCGGFTEYADKHHVRIVRGSQVIISDSAAAARGAPGATDPVVYPGDQITVPRTIF